MINIVNATDIKPETFMSVSDYTREFLIGEVFKLSTVNHYLAQDSALSFKTPTGETWVSFKLRIAQRGIGTVKEFTYFQPRELFFAPDKLNKALTPEGEVVVYP